MTEENKELEQRSTVRVKVLDNTDCADILVEKYVNKVTPCTAAEGTKHMNKTETSDANKK